MVGLPRQSLAISFLTSAFDPKLTLETDFLNGRVETDFDHEHVHHIFERVIGV
jgi:hypothetical protein